MAIIMEIISKKSAEHGEPREGDKRAGKLTKLEQITSETTEKLHKYENNIMIPLEKSVQCEYEKHLDYDIS